MAVQVNYTKDSGVVLGLGYVRWVGLTLDVQNGTGKIHIAIWRDSDAKVAGLPPDDFRSVDMPSGAVTTIVNAISTQVYNRIKAQPWATGAQDVADV